MPKITLKPEEAREIVQEDHERAKVVSDEMVGKSRWTIRNRCIFELDGKLYRVYYSTGATEHQFMKPFEDDSSVDCVEVREVQKTVTAWEPVEG